MKGASAPSASASDSKPSGVADTPGGCDAIHTWTTWEPHGVHHGQVQGAASGSGQPPVSGSGWGMNGLKAALWQRTWECWQMKSWTAQNDNCILGCIRSSMASRLRGVILPTLFL